MKLSELSNNYVALYDLYRKEADRIEARIKKRQDQITRLEAKRRRLEHPSWIDLIVEGIAKEIIPSMPDRTYEVMGPFGIGATTSIHFIKDKTHPLEDVLSITFRPGDLSMGELNRVEYSVDTGEFKSGSIGAMNELNRPAVSISPDTEIADLAQFME